MDDLTAFITARLAEDEATANAAEAELAALPGDYPRDTHLVYRLQHAGFQLAYQGFALVNDPARALREVAARRRTMARHEREADKQQPWCAWCTDDRHFEAWPCDDIRDLAATWSDHGDYRPEWAPGL